MNKIPLDIEGLYLFTQVVQTGSFARVSSNLKIPKPTLSRKIQNLESHLGVQLLVRTTRSVRPTEIGREFYQRALAVIAASNDAQALVDKTKREPQGLLRVTAGVEYGMAVMSSIVNSFSKKYPAVNTELDLTGRQVDLPNEGFDVAIRIGPLLDSSLSSRKLGSITYGLYASPTYLRGAKKISVPEDLVRHPTLVFTRSRAAETWSLFNGEQEIDIQTSARIRANNYWVLRKAAENSLGIVFMPQFLVDDALCSNLLQRILPEWTSTEIPIHALYPAQRYLSPKVRLFIDHVIQSIQLRGGE